MIESIVAEILKTLIPFIVVGGVLAMLFGGKTKKKWSGKRQGYGQTYKEKIRPYDQRDYQTEPKKIYTTDDKLDALSSEKLRLKNPVGYKAYGVQRVIEKLLKTMPLAKNGRVYPEVGMGAFIEVEGYTEYTARDDDKRTAFYAFNAKRVDFLVIKANGAPAFAVEYHGSGHYVGQSAPKRDVLKKEALRQAGIELVEIQASASQTEIETLLKAAIERNFRPAPAPFVKEVPSSAERVTEIAENYGQDGQKKTV